MNFWMGLTMGIALGAFLVQLGHWSGHRRPRTATGGVKAQTYGHPHPPVPWVRSHIPDAPTGFFWEVRVERDGSGNPWLHLALISATSGKPVSQMKRDLVRGGYRTYAEDYRRYSILKGDTFKNDLMGPLLDWAQRQVDKYGNHTDEYAVET